MVEIDAIIPATNWHDLEKNPDDLPRRHIPVLTISRNEVTGGLSYGICERHYGKWIDRCFVCTGNKHCVNTVYAWKYIERFEGFGY